MTQARLISHKQVVARSLKQPDLRRERKRTALARAVALRLVEYRADHGLSQRALARQLGMPQSVIARLEAGDHAPSVETLHRISRGLRIEFHIDITPWAVQLTA